MSEMTPLPCPWCGGNALNGRTRVWWVSCQTCGADGPHFPTAREAIAAWNKVAGERAARQEAERAATLRGVKAGLEAAWKVLAGDIHGRGIDRSIRHIRALDAARIAEKAQP